MITEFSVTNFLSFKDKVTFSMIGENVDDLDDNYLEVHDKKILKSAVIYGGNATGKSNLIRVLTIVVMMLRESNGVSGDSKLPVAPFKFDNDSIKKPSEFEIKFIVEDVEYNYRFMADQNKIQEESLYYYEEDKKIKIFERTNENKYSFIEEDKEKLQEIVAKNAPNKFFLATAASDYDKIKIPYKFLSTSVNTFGNMNELRDIAFRQYLQNKDELKEFVLDFFNEAELDIEDFDVFESDVPDEVIQRFPEHIRNQMTEKPKIIQTLLKHKETDVALMYEEESLGTQTLFSFLPFIMDALNNQKVVIVDELDKGLHPSIVKLIVDLFHNPETDSKNAQLIFNTNDANLLDLDCFRRDQIWFMEKNMDDGVSYLYPSNDLTERKNGNVGKGYIIGKYGDIPFIRNTFTLKEK